MPYCNEFNGFGPNIVIGKEDGSATTADDKIVCNGQARGANKASLTAGTTLALEATVAAPHPGDCALYVSFDTDAVPDTEKRWAKIWEEKDCLCHKNPDGSVRACPARPAGHILHALTRRPPPASA